MMKRLFTLLLIIFVLLQPLSAVFAQPEEADAFNPDELKCTSAIMVEQNTGKVILERNSKEKLYPASLTKVLTALLAIENLDLNETLKIGREINLKSLDASGAGLVAGEVMTTADLLRALLIPSGNDAAYSVAVQVARKTANNSSMGVQEATDFFADLMTKRAKELGAVDSNFVNPHGYHDDNHYTTAYDMYLIVKEAMKHDIFREIVKTQYYSTKDAQYDSSIEGKKVEHSWVNRNLLLGKKSGYYYKEATGVKTGFTSKAGYCLISSAENEELNVVLVALNFPVEKDRWNESIELLDYALTGFQIQTVVKKDDAVTNIKVGKKYLKKTVNLDVLAEKEYKDLFNKKDIPEIKTNFMWDNKFIDAKQESGSVEKLIGPIEKGQILGKAVYSLNSKVLSEVNLIASDSVMKLNIFDHVLRVGDFLLKNWYIIVIPLVILGLLLVVGKISRMKKSDGRKGMRVRRKY